MRYYKQIDNGYILAIGTGGGGTEITAAEYDEIMSVIQQKPQATATTDYHLKTDLTWESYQVEPPAPDYTPPDNLDAVSEYLLDGDMVEMPAPDAEPDYFDEHAPEPDYFME